MLLLIVGDFTVLIILMRAMVVCVLVLVAVYAMVVTADDSGNSFRRNWKECRRCHKECKGRCEDRNGESEVKKKKIIFGLYYKM